MSDESQLFNEEHYYFMDAANNCKRAKSSEKVDAPFESRPSAGASDIKVNIMTPQSENVT